MIPINIIFLLGNGAYWFKVIVYYIKPFLDAYQASFKEKCKYFPGLKPVLWTAIYANISINRYPSDPLNTVAILGGIGIV